MATIVEAIKVLAAHLGVRPAAVAWRTRRLTEAELLPRASGRRATHWTVGQLGAAVLGLVLDTPGRELASAVQRYGALVPCGVTPCLLPASVRVPDLATHLAVILHALSDESNPAHDTALNSRIEIDLAWPAVTINGTRFVEAGTDPSRWRAHVRRAVTVTGRALKAAVDNIFETKRKAA